MSVGPEIRLAAVKIGDLLKNDTSVKQIDRTASSIFGLDRQSHEHPGISSERAQRIFDWLMSLYQLSRPDAEKHRLATMFVTNITPDARRPEVDRVLVEAGMVAVEHEGDEAAKVEASAETELLKKVFRPELLQQLPLDAALNGALTARMTEAQACIEGRAYLAAVILAGSVLEGLCLGHGRAHAERVRPAYEQVRRKPASPLERWTLSEWIDVLGYLGDLTPNVKTFGHHLREFRNYVHPAEQLAQRFTPDQHTALIGFHVVVAAIESLVRASESQKAGAP